ncbi:S8 family serine peptidase [Longispora sp. K20-0274]|uniref:S8 family serine peptidase n=1 Tax=Longispora sp. K20-0274 TaxID=3088255 RepID=UPI00399B16A5
MALSTVLGTFGAVPAGADPGPAPSTAGPQAFQAPKQVTLITGDRVTLRTGRDGFAPAEITAGPGREKVTFIRQRGPKGWSVVPADAMPLLAQGRLDPRLFDVSTLAATGYDDGSRADLPLLVQYREGQVRTNGLAASNVRDLGALDLVALSQPRAKAGDLWRGLTPGAGTMRALDAPIAKVWLDGKSKIQLDRSVPRIGAPEAWAAGYTGDGVKVAVLDTGYDPTHPDLAGKVIGSENFTPDADVVDHNGHGTHVASTVAGSGAASGGRFKGVAPGAQLLVGKVCTSDGECTDSSVIGGLSWAAIHGAKVINLSLGTPDVAPDNDVVGKFVDAITAQYGTLVVAAAGNYGRDTIISPAQADSALAVGATLLTPNDVVWHWSSTGPRHPDGAIKPDLVAPGVGIVAARAAGTGEPFEDNENYTEMSGTSMATPHVTGSVAILAQQHPTWTPAQLKAQLMGSTNQAAELGSYIQGAGRLDVARAVNQHVMQEPASLSFGMVRWPYKGNLPMAKTLTYNNDGDQPVTLQLSQVELDGLGKPAPAGLFTLGATELTVPAKGSARTTVRVDSAKGQPDTYSGTVIARSADGAVQVRTAVGVQLEEESYDLAVTVVGRDGAVPAFTDLRVYDLDRQRTYFGQLNGNTYRVRLHAGKFTATAVLGTARAGDPDQQDIALGAEPEINLRGDRMLTFDARKGRAVANSAPDKSARIASATIGTVQLTAGATYVTGLQLRDFNGGSTIDGIYTIPSAGTGSDQFLYENFTQWAKPKGDGTYDDTPYVYHLAKVVPGRIPADGGYRPATSDLARVTTTFAAAADKHRGSHEANPLLNGVDPGLPGGAVGEFAMPSTRTDYYSVSGALTWAPVFMQLHEPPDSWSNFDRLTFGNARAYKAGAKSAERWNGAVFAVGLYKDVNGNRRVGDTLWLGMDLGANGVIERAVYEHDNFETKVVIYRNGERIYAGPYRYVGYTLPPDPKEAEYRIVLAHHTAPGDARLSTVYQAEWTFRSKTAPGTTPVALPLSAVRINPDLDIENRAPGGTFTLPVTVQREIGAGAVSVKKLTAEVSYDDGATWKPAKVGGRGAAWTATVENPRRSAGKYVSLRFAVTDAAGVTFTERIDRAYQLR